MQINEVEFYLKAFNQWLGIHPSATRMLEVLVENKIVVEKHAQDILEPDSIVLQQLEASKMALEYRRVFLIGGNQLLSKAHNWYVPQRLTLHMKDQLKKTDQPFGYVIRDTKFSRQTIETMLFPENFDKNDIILRHQAVLYSRGEEPISFVEEAYYPVVLELFIEKYKNKISNTILT